MPKIIMQMKHFNQEVATRLANADHSVHDARYVSRGSCTLDVQNRKCFDRLSSFCFAVFAPEMHESLKAWLDRQREAFLGRVGGICWWWACKKADVIGKCFHQSP